MRLFTSIIEGQNAHKEINAGVRFRGTDGFDVFPGPQARLELEAGELGCESIRLGRLSSTGHRYRFENGIDDWIGLNSPTAGDIRAVTPDGLVAASPGGVLLLGPGRRDLDVQPVSTGAFRSRHLQISRQSLYRYLAEDEVAVAGGIRSFSAGNLAELGILMRTLAGVVEDPAHLSRELVSRRERQLIELTVALLFAVGAVEPRRPVGTGSLADVRRAEDFIRSHAGDDISMSDVARELGVSTRSVQATFRKYRGISPYAYLDAVRLGQARQRLVTIEPGETVASIALEAGFGHLGRFSGRYRRWYGESPSRTAALTRRLGSPQSDPQSPRAASQSG
jgi:AraC-like DNA-binding protein